MPAEPRVSNPRSWSPVLLLPLVLAGCLEPHDRRPGLRLTGDVVTEQVADWSFADAHPEIFLETRTPYALRHSVTIVCATAGGELYVGARRPREKSWVGYVARDPRVRLKIGEQLFPRRLERVAADEEIETVYAAFAAKYGRELLARNERPQVWYFRVVAED